MKYLNKTNNPKVALEIIKRQRPRFIAKASVGKPYAVKAKSGLSESISYFAEYIFSDVYKDLDGDKIPQIKLEQQIDGMKGDLEHCNLLNLEGFDKSDLFTVVKSQFIGDTMTGTILFNTNHKQFEAVWNEVLNDKFGISLEVDKDDFTIGGITGALNPRVQRAKLLNAYAA